MNKEELLKIFSAYLPYGLQISTDDEGEDWIETVIGVNNEAVETSVGNYWDFTVKPILYDLSCLTKEIEHEGERFIPLIELAKINAPQRRFKINGSLVVDDYSYRFFYNQNSFIWVHGVKAHTVINQRQLFEKLYEWHFNVFNLPADQFINKATLNK